LIDAVVVDPDVVRGTLAVLEEELERAARRDRELGPVELVPLGGHDGAAGRGRGRRGGRARRRARRQEAPDQEQGRSATNEPVHRRPSATLHPTRRATSRWACRTMPTGPPSRRQISKAIAAMSPSSIPLSR